MAELGGYGYPMRPGHQTPIDFRFTALTYSWMMRFGPQRLSRDIRLVHRSLLSQGRVVWLGERYEQQSGGRTADLDNAVRRVRALFGYG